MRWGAKSRIVGHEGKYIICLLSREFTLGDGCMCRLHVSLFQEPSGGVCPGRKEVVYECCQRTPFEYGTTVTVWESAASRTVKLLLAACNNE